VLAKNFGVPQAAFANLPVDVEHQRYIFPGPMPGPIAADAVASPAGVVPHSFSYRLLDQEPIELAGGRVRIVDSSNFPAASTIAAALVEVAPGGLRELHWHPNADEWQYYISGQGRMAVFASNGKATFDYQAGDVGYVPFAMGHYVENTSDEPLRFLELFRSSRFADVSLNQWMAMTPPELVRAHLNLDGATIAALRKDEPVVVAAGPAQRGPRVLPEWPADTIAVLTTVDDLPYAIPVTAPVRAGDDRILLSLSRDHASLRRLREHPQVAVAILAEGDDAFTARGRASVVQEPMARAPEFAAVMIEVDHVDDHRSAGLAVEAGVRVRWTGQHAQDGARERVEALREMARSLQ
jgi:oxalate decarboxylase